MAKTVNIRPHITASIFHQFRPAAAAAEAVAGAGAGACSLTGSQFCESESNQNQLVEANQINSHSLYVV